MKQLFLRVKYCFLLPVFNIAIFSLFVLGLTVIQHYILKKKVVLLPTKHFFVDIMRIRPIQMAESTVGELVLLLSVLLSYYIIRYCSGTPHMVWGSLSKPKSFSRFIAGIIIGVLLNVSQLFLLLFCALYFIVEMSNGSSFMLYPALGYTFLVAVCEELIFRGYVFQTLEDRYGTAKSLFVTTSLFSLVHVVNLQPQFNAGQIVLNFIVPFAGGILYASAYIATRNLWTAIGVHWSWNFFHAAVFSAPPIEPLGFITFSPVLADKPSILWYSVDITSVLFFLLVSLSWVWMAKRRGRWKPPTLAPITLQPTD